MQAGQISEREPRKGTETNVGHLHRVEANRISEREPRKGTETVATSVIATSIAAFQNVNPERGRKHVEDVEDATQNKVHFRT